MAGPVGVTSPRLSIRPTTLAGCYIVEPGVAEDERGTFARTFCSEIFDGFGLDSTVVQCNVSRNRVRGTLRGLHYQAAPYGETKLVSCSQGRIFDVAVDLRPGSETFAHWASVELSAANLLAMYIPEGMAHGFVTLEPEAEVRYQVSAPYHPDSARGVRWDDPDIGVEWPDLGPLTMSDRDRHLPGVATVRSTLGVFG